MKIKTKLFTQQDYEKYYPELIEKFAKDLFEEEGKYPSLDYAKKAARQFVDSKFLPQGFKTPGHYFYHIKDHENNIIGLLWFYTNYHSRFYGEQEVARICDLHVFSKYQRKGYGLAIMKLAEEILHEVHQVKTITLNVFQTNDAAYKLYRRLNYKIRNKGTDGKCEMCKVLHKPTEALSEGTG